MSDILETHKRKRGRPRKTEIAGASVRETMEQLVAVVPAPDAPAKRVFPGSQKRPRPTTKKQITVRIDKQLLQTVKQRAAKQRMDLTDAVEQGLWLYLGEESAEATRQLRFLVNALPLGIQKRLLTTAQYMISKELSPFEQRLRTYLVEVFDLFAQDPRAERALGELKPPQLEA
jgi:uncharacterized protein (DUF4415 family)